MVFERKWWYDIYKDFDRDWWDDHAKTIQTGITLKQDETIYLEAHGEDDKDQWRIFATSGGFRYQRAVRVIYENKTERCENDDDLEEGDSAYKCKGCSACADVIPVYEV